MALFCAQLYDRPMAVFSPLTSRYNINIHNHSLIRKGLSCLTLA